MPAHRARVQSARDMCILMRVKTGVGKRDQRDEANSGLGVCAHLIYGPGLGATRAAVRSVCYVFHSLGVLGCRRAIAYCRASVTGLRVL
jgi:hypothetical protein